MYNKRIKTVMESINVVIDDTIPKKDVGNNAKFQALRRMRVMVTCLKVIRVRDNH